MEKGCEHPPGGIFAAQVFVHHVSGDFHPMLRADVVVIFGTGGRPSPRANSVRLDAGIFSGSSPKYEMAFAIAPLTAGSTVAQMNQQTRTSMASATHTAAAALRPAGRSPGRQERSRHCGP